MWVCRICMVENDAMNDCCSTCLYPKDCTEHLVIQKNEPNAEDQLQLCIGDVISVLRKDRGKWRGKLGIQEGWFPTTCVDNKIIKREKYRVIKSVSDENAGHLNLDEGNEVIVVNKKCSGEMWVVYGNKGRWIPETYLEKVTTDKVLPNSAPKPIKQPHESRKESALGTLQRSTHLKKYRVLYDYADDDLEHLEIVEGDIVLIVGVEQNGWLAAQIGHEKGFVPASYVQLLENQDDEIFCVTDLYSGEEIRDLKLHIGDVVKVVNRRRSGWVWVNHNQTEGWYPKNHMKLIDDSSEIDKPPVIPKRFKTVHHNDERVENTTKSTYGNITEHSYGNTENISEQSNGVLGQNSACIGIGDLIKRQSSLQTVGGCSDETNSEQPPTPARRQNILTSNMKFESRDLPQNTYGNTACQNNETIIKPPILPKRQNIAQVSTKIESKVPTSNTYGNTDYYGDEPTTKPPILPKREKIAEASKQIDSKVPTSNTYGNTDYYGDDVKNKPLEVKENEEPKPRCRTNDTDEEKLDSSSHIYDYIQEKYETYTKPIVKDKCEPAESRNTASSDKPALPKRPPPPSRPLRPELEEKVQIRNDEDIKQMASLYGRREENEIRFVMVGRTGSGKSATGNTIMAKADHFESKLSGGSVTRECKRGECNKAGRKIVLVDTPGLFDTQVPFEQISKEIIRCVNMSTPGPHAFLLVIQIARFTDEEIETFNRLFDLFGDGMGKFAIITFTKLDDLEREKTTIEQYIEMAPQKLKDFLKRCQGRYLAIDNKASETKKAAKVKTLIQLVDDIVNKNRGKCYTNEMYKEAEAALQRKIKELEEEKAREKKKEIDQIQSKFAHQIDSIKKDNKKLAKEVSSNQTAQRQFQREKEKAQQETNRMKVEMKKIDKKRNEEIYLIKKKEKEEKEKQARDLEQKERQHLQLLQSMQQQQAETNRRYQDMERQKELQLSKVTEDHNKRMEAEIQRIVDGSDEKYKHMMQALEAKDKGYEKLQEQMAQQNLKMQEIMREKDRDFLKQQDENRKRIEQEKDRSNETLRNQLDEQKRSLDATRDIILQEQKERDQRQREEYQELKRQYERTQEQMKSKGCMQS